MQKESFDSNLYSFFLGPKNVLLNKFGFYAAQQFALFFWIEHTFCEKKLLLPIKDHLIS